MHWQQGKFAFIFYNFDNMFLRWGNHGFIKYVLIVLEFYKENRFQRPQLLHQHEESML